MMEVDRLKTQRFNKGRDGSAKEKAVGSGCGKRVKG